MDSEPASLAALRELSKVNVSTAACTFSGYGWFSGPSSTNGRTGAGITVCLPGTILTLGEMGSLSDWLDEMPARPWMAGQRKVPLEIVD